MLRKIGKQFKYEDAVKINENDKVDDAASIEIKEDVS